MLQLLLYIILVLFFVTGILQIYLQLTNDDNGASNPKFSNSHAPDDFLLPFLPM